MSFVKKHIKRVWNITKKVVKSKVFKYVAIAAAIFFTAGIAAGGFAAFAGVSTVGGFFGAVGATMATGGAAIAGALGMTGLSTTLAGYGGAAASAAGMAGALPSIGGIAAGGLSLTASGSVAAPLLAGGGTAGWSAVAAAGTAATTGTSAATGQIVATGISGAMTAMASGKNKQKYPNGYVAGGTARGGGDSPPPAHTFDFGETPEAAGGMAAPQAGLVGAPDTPVSAQQFANAAPISGDAPAAAPLYAQNTIDRIRSRIQAPTTDPAAGYAAGYGAPEDGQQQQPFAFNPGPFQSKATQIGGLIGGRV